MPLLTLSLLLATQTVPQPPLEIVPPGAFPAPQLLVVPGPPPDDLPVSPATPPRPMGSPTDWVSNDDYPPPALRAGEEGIVGFVLLIDAQGVVANCYLSKSSGSVVLDATTCSLMRRRARFSPARDRDGNPIPSVYRSRVRWEIPVDRYPFASWVSITRVVLNPTGTIRTCAVENSGPVPPDQVAACPNTGEIPGELIAAIVAGATGPVTLTREWRHVADGIAAPFDETKLAGQHRFETTTERFDVDERGDPMNCTAIDIGPDGTQTTACSGLHYVADGRHHRGISTVVWSTSGSPPGSTEPTN